MREENNWLDDGGPCDRYEDGSSPIPWMAGLALFCSGLEQFLMLLWYQFPEVFGLSLFYGSQSGLTVIVIGQRLGVCMSCSIFGTHLM